LQAVYGSPFGAERDGRTHHGIDFRAPIGTGVLAVAPGTVDGLGWDDAGGGWFIRLRHADGTTTHYGHLAEFIVERSGDAVEAGARIAYSGNTGTTTGPHLHFGWRRDGQWLDPTSALGLSSSRTNGRGGLVALVALVALVVVGDS
jgi:murein DD-endopeptidase MepM/ murein hydrolase activator NlpD